MEMSKRVVLTGLAGVAAGLSAVVTQAVAQAKKSQNLSKLADDEVLRVNPATGSIQKSNIPVSAARHEAAMTKGAKEIAPTTVVYKHAGKMYMFDYGAAADTQAAENFESQFDND